MAKALIDGEYGRLYPEEEALRDPCIALKYMSGVIRGDIENGGHYSDDERSALRLALLRSEGASGPVTELGRLVMIASEVTPVMGRLAPGADGSKMRVARNGDGSPMLRKNTAGDITKVMVPNVRPMSLQERGITPRQISTVVVEACKKILATSASGTGHDDEAANRLRRADVATWRPLLGRNPKPLVGLLVRQKNEVAYYFSSIMWHVVENNMAGYLEVTPDAPVLDYASSFEFPAKDKTTGRSFNWFGLRSPV